MSLPILKDLGEIFSTRTRKEALLGLVAGYMLVQLSSLPIALALPSLSVYFNTSIENTAWVVIISLLVLGSLVLLAARLGDRLGHTKIFVAGIVVLLPDPMLEIGGFVACIVLCVIDRVRRSPAKIG